MLFRRKPAAVSNPSATPETPPPKRPEQALRAELTALLAGYDNLAQQIANGKLEDFPAILEDRSDAVRDLFLRTNATGELRGCYYYYTEDLSKLSEQAQGDLVEVFGGGLKVKFLLKRYFESNPPNGLAAVVALIEQMRARIQSFLLSLDTFELVGQALANEISPEDFRTAILGVAPKKMEILQRLLDRALDGRMMKEAINANLPRLIVMTVGKVEEPEPTTVNGVWLPKKIADKYFAAMAGMQAQAMRERPSA